MLVAVVARMLRDWMLPHAVGVDASLLDAVAVLIALVTLGQLPLGPSVGAAAAVLILGASGVAAAAAAGVLLTVTGTIGDCVSPPGRGQTTCGRNWPGPGAPARTASSG